MTTREEFPLPVKRALAERVAQTCSNPNCRATTSGPHTEPGVAIMLGVASHIAAAGRGGPRYDESMPSAERVAATNGIWLCQNCAKLIDNDVTRFTVELLLKWKKDAEDESIARLGKPGVAESARVHIQPPRLLTEIETVRLDILRHCYEAYMARGQHSWCKWKGTRDELMVRIREGQFLHSLGRIEVHVSIDFSRLEARLLPLGRIYYEGIAEELKMSTNDMEIAQTPDIVENEE